MPSNVVSDRPSVFVAPLGPPSQITVPITRSPTSSPSESPSDAPTEERFYYPDWIHEEQFCINDELDPEYMVVLQKDNYQYRSKLECCEVRLSVQEFLVT